MASLLSLYRTLQKGGVMNDVEQYLQMMVATRKLTMKDHAHSFKYCGIEDFVLCHGVGGKSTPVPDWVETKRYSEVKNCYGNAWHLANDYPDEFIYVEGFAAGFVPMQHAWVMGYDGNIYDPTWEQLEYDYTDSDYLGVPFKLSYVNKTSIRYGVFGVLSPLEFSNPDIIQGRLDPKEAFAHTLVGHHVDVSI